MNVNTRAALGGNVGTKEALQLPLRECTTGQRPHGMLSLRFPQKLGPVNRLLTDKLKVGPEESIFL